MYETWRGETENERVYDMAGLAGFAARQPQEIGDTKSGRGRAKAAKDRIVPQDMATEKRKPSKKK